MAKGDSFNDWNAIALKLPGRSNKDCRKRWAKICTNVKKGAWDVEEDKKTLGRSQAAWPLVGENPPLCLFLTIGSTERRFFLFFFFSFSLSDKYHSWTEVAQEVQTRHADRTYTLYVPHWPLPYWFNKSAQKGGSILWILQCSILNGRPRMTKSYYGQWRSLDEAGPVSVRKDFPLVLLRISKTGLS